MPMSVPVFGMNDGELENEARGCVDIAGTILSTASALDTASIGYRRIKGRSMQHNS
jgi:hypothetical protein